MSGQSVGGSTSGAAFYCSTSNSGFIGLSGHNGTSINWESSTDGGVSWTSTGNTTSNQSYFNLNQSTCYRAIVQDGIFPPDTSSVSCVVIAQPTIAGTISGTGLYCSSSANGSINLSGNIGNVLYWQASNDGGTTWSNIPSASTTFNFIGLTQTTIFEAVVQNTIGCLVDTSNAFTVTIAQPSVGGNTNLSGNDTVCYAFNQDTIFLNGYTGNITQWIATPDNGANWLGIANTSPVLIPQGITQSLTFYAVVQSNSCPADTSSGIIINVLPPPAPVDAGNDVSIVAGSSTQLHGSGTGTPYWIPISSLNNPTIFNPIANPVGTTDYVLTVIDSQGCLNADTVRVNVTQTTFNGTISNYFTPNGDGINDTWFIQNIQYFTNNEVFIYNIYGQEIFSKKGYNNEWNGKYNGTDLPDGTYYYTLKIEGESKTYRGSIDILRKK